MMRYPVAIVSLFLIGALAAGGGCATRAELTLYQPDAPPAQRELQLESEWAAFAPQADRLAVVLQFPLPGALDGARDYHLYLVVPNDAGTHEVGPAVRGFLVQSVGARRGKTAIVGGTVRLAPSGLQPKSRSIRLALDTADGCRLLGEATLEQQPATLRQFQRQFAGDVAALRSAAAAESHSAPASSGAQPQPPQAAPGAESQAPRSSSDADASGAATPANDALKPVPNAPSPAAGSESPPAESDEPDEPALRETPARGGQ